MSSRLSKLILDAQHKAMSLRRRLKQDPFAPINVYDLAEQLGVEVRFVDAPSMEGMYSRVPKPVILISAHRPSGRKVFTCGHEIGHHEFNHGMHIDELLEDAPHSSAEEILANAFSAALLMPKAGIGTAFTSRGWSLQAPSPQQVYAVACLFGVGYTTLITHMAQTLNFLTPRLEKELSKYQPKNIRKELLGFEYDGNLTVVDEHWSGTAADMEIGDMLLLPAGIRSEQIGLQHRISLVDDDGKHTLYQATTPGIGRVASPDGGFALYIRVSRKGFVGRSIFRHEEDPDAN